MYARMCVCMYVHMCVYMCVCMYVHMCVCMCMCVYLCACVCIYVCTMLYGGAHMWNVHIWETAEVHNTKTLTTLTGVPCHCLSY